MSSFKGIRRTLAGAALAVTATVAIAGMAGGSAAAATQGGPRSEYVGEYVACGAVAAEWNASAQPGESYVCYGYSLYRVWA
ncbi:hypothetical protein OG206_01125 [Streptomyces sp. NBC_01341]|uniref:hypothetical protein n=1 Tax=Streptomyces sp. NBC_01341 TaxID=2903831 RepID=UPI002E150E02|nr:hypothetical protein OG206_01125 [Streptomyces sp. NBC_01341]